MDVTAEKAKIQDSSPDIYYFGILFGFIGIFILLAARVILWIQPPIPKCLFKELTGYPCVTCGSTRSLEELSQFHFFNAFLMNPLIFLTGLGFGLFALYSVGVYLFNFPKYQFTFIHTHSKLIRIFIVLAILLNWIYLIKAGI